MADRKAIVPLADGTKVEGVEVYPKESTERWSEFELEDGTTLRLKMTIAKFIRVDGHFDNDGNPIYAVNGAPQITFVQVPERFRRKPS